MTSPVSLSEVFSAPRLSAKPDWAKELPSSSATGPLLVPALPVLPVPPVPPLLPVPTPPAPALPITVAARAPIFCWITVVCDRATALVTALEVVSVLGEPVLLLLSDT
ncbi:hypothetical protein TALK_10625 [Thalassospira alkalitolerans]|uniref:Uncharacterized protein n=1 Tax=Thalassospira alkalitolerans TaxID=1293890 RepID=A0A1Y2LEA4_9PROT|nr:hypothetical protein TALK_10625 [Thalassospira alkalitolerans]